MQNAILRRDFARRRGAVLEVREATLSRTQRGVPHRATGSIIATSQRVALAERGVAGSGPQRPGITGRRRSGPRGTPEFLREGFLREDGGWRRRRARMVG